MYKFLWETIKPKERLLNFFGWLFLALLLLTTSIYVIYITWHTPYWKSTEEIVESSKNAEGIPLEIIKLYREIKRFDYFDFNRNKHLFVKSEGWEGKIVIDEIKSLGGRWAGENAELFITEPIETHIKGNSKRQT